LSERSQVRSKVLIAFGIVVLVLLADQVLKYWIKTNMTLAQEINILGNWFILHFTENDGMAFGLELGGITGKLLLTSFRILAVSAISYYLVHQIKKGISTGLVILISFILAGAVGNIIDSVFYGVLFTESTFMTKASLAGDLPGYSGWFRGKVVDMLYFPVIETHYPDWFPRWGGQKFIFFRPVFNIADASISLGVFSILLFQRQAFMPPKEQNAEISSKDEINDSANFSNELGTTPTPDVDADSDGSVV